MAADRPQPHLRRSAAAWAARRRCSCSRRYPRLLAGAAAFDSVADFARQYRSFPSIPCGKACRKRWNGSVGRSLQSLARQELGGTPRTSARRVRGAQPGHLRARDRGVVRAAPALVERRPTGSSSTSAGSRARCSGRIRRLNPRAPVRRTSATGSTRTRCGRRRGCRSRSRTSGCCRRARRAARGGTHRPGACPLLRALASASEQVVAQAEVHQHREQRQADDRVADVDRLPERAPTHFSTRAITMCPPSSGSTGSRFRSPRARLTRPRTNEEVRRAPCAPCEPTPHDPDGARDVARVARRSPGWPIPSPSRP